MRSKFLLTMALIMVVAAAFTTIGMAYTASTENTGNTTTSDYVVLEQFNYTLSSDDGVRFDIITTETGDVYQVKNVTPLIEIDGVEYSGFKFGEDQLSAHVVGSDKVNLKVSVTTTDLGFGDGFTPYEEMQDWRYILKVEYNRFIVLIDPTYLSTLGAINLVKIDEEGEPSIQTITESYSIPGQWRIWGNSAPGDYTYNADDVCTIGEKKFLVLVHKDVTLSNYNVVKINTESTLEIGNQEGTAISGTWCVWGQGEPSYTVTVSSADAYPKNAAVSTQYAIYDGTGTGDNIQWSVINPKSAAVLMNKSGNDPISGTWKVWGRGDITSSYKVDGGHAHNRFILLMDPDCEFSGLTVIKITNSGGYEVSYETCKKEGDVIAGSWKKWNTGAAGSYTVSLADNRNGFIVLTGDGVTITDGKYAVVEVKNRLDIEKDLTYTTTLYFAGPTRDSNTLLRSPTSTIKTSSDITLEPLWTIYKGTEGYKITLKPNTSDGGVGSDRVYYIGKDDALILPENPYTNDTKEFVGWKDEGLGKIYPPWYVFEKTEQDRTLTAQWSTSYLTVTFAANGGGGSMTAEHVVSGNTFTLPMCSFTAPNGKMFTGWVVTGASSRDYSLFDQPLESIINLTENITVTAQWATITVGYHKVTIDGASYDVYTDKNGKYTIPYNMLAPPAELFIDDFSGWQFTGWIVIKTSSSYKVAQAYSNPIGHDHYIIKDGIIKFKYDSTEVGQ